MDKFCPHFTAEEKVKRLYRTPLSKKILAEIRKKQHLLKLSKADPSLLDKYKKQRNLVAKLTRENKKAYENSVVRSTKNVKDLSKAVKMLQNDEITNMNGNPSLVKIENKHGVELAQAMGKFYKSRAEDLITVAPLGLYYDQVK